MSITNGFAVTSSSWVSFSSVTNALGSRKLEMDLRAFSLKPLTSGA